MKTPFISLVLPVYNVEAYVERCVESIVHQDYDDYEVILVDDGSTDTSGRICDDLAKKYDKVTAVHKLNGGLSDARNYGLERVCGKYVAFIDSDDWIDKRYFKVVHNHLSASKADIFKYGYQKVQGGVYGNSVSPFFPEGVYDRGKVEKLLLPEYVGPSSLFVYEKNAVRSAWSHVYSVEFLRNKRITFISERVILNEDYLLNLHTMLYARRVEIVHDILYYYDYREGSLSKRYVKNEFDRKCCLHAENQKLLKEAGVFGRYEKQFYNMCLDGFYACCVNECSGWGGSPKQAIQNIRKIMDSRECREVVRKIQCDSVGGKAHIIVGLMRWRLSGVFYYLYKMSKRNG